jgi:hypothetical protein
MADKAPSLWEDCLEIFYAPGAVFARRRDDPAFGGALLVLLVVSIGLALAFQGAFEPLLEADLRRNFAQAMKDDPRLTPEMMERSIAFGKRFFLLGVGAFALVLPIAIGAAVWLAGKLVDSKAGFGHAVMVATFAMYARIPETVVNALQALLLPEDALKGQMGVKLGVSRFLDPDRTSQLVMALAGRVDLFTLWVTAIIATGIAVTGPVSRGRAWAAAGLVWLVGAVPGVWGALK